MNPELAKLLSLGQTAPPSVAGTPVANAIKRLMGSGGSAPMPSQYNQGNQMLQDRSTAGQGAAEQSLRAQPDQSSHGAEMLRDRAYGGQAAAEQSLRSGEADVPMSTEEELEMARKGMGGGRHLQ